ncbi:MAG: hypothetical protein QOD55_2124, partial [Solirubrobacteraceae bacterium]|nr:hypothetical protein [Solirubrobacteraceae bacterium]
GRDRPFGVLGALATRPRAFSRSDVNVMQAVANVLGAAVARREAEHALLAVKEAERRRIARDLHDEALHDLTYALAEADRARRDIAAGTGAGAQRLSALVSALKRIGEQLRGAVYDLRLAGEQDRPFTELLEGLVTAHRAMAAECDVALQLGDGVPAGSLGATGTEVLRILGEALTNARRHAGAGHVRVAVRGSGNTLRAEVSDDGRGFDPASPAGVEGTGIAGMRERADLLGAHLEIHATPGTGTRVHLEVGLADDRETSRDPVRVLLVEDHAAVRQAIAAAFEREADFEVVGQAASLAEARTMLGEVDVDVAVVDLGLPDGYGGDLVPELRDANPRSQALVLSASLERAEMARAVAKGAAAALNKTAHLDELVDSVRRLRAGETLLPLDEVVELLRFAGRQSESEHEDREAIARLTRREREILQGLADGLDSQAMADRLHITLRTQRNHVANILAKLGVHSQLQALVFALRYDIVEVRRGVPPAPVA